MSAKSKTDRTYAGLSTAERDAERYTAFINAGVELIGGKGYKAATVRAVCKAAGYTDRYFYSLFGNTEGLLSAVYQEVSTDLYQQLQDAMAQAPDTLEGRVGALLDMFFEYLRDSKKARLFLFEHIDISEELNKQVIKSHMQFGRLITTADPHLVGETKRENNELRRLGYALMGAMAFSLMPAMGTRSREKAAIKTGRTILLGALQRYRKESH